MQVLRTAVLLYRENSSISIPHPASWYESYIFTSPDGIMSYWFKQTNGGVVISGQVFDWAVIRPTDFSNRTNVAWTALFDALTVRKIDLSLFDCLCVFIATSAPADGGSTSVYWGPRFGVVVEPIGTPFDILAHEFGHQIGLEHSFGNPSYKNASWSAPGEYGHPFCIMSAQGYGNNDPTYTPPGPPSPLPENTRLGPCLNGATAAAKGWVDASDYFLSSGIPREFDIKSLGSPAGNFWQAVRIHIPNGDIFTVDFRTNADKWDAGLPSPLICINHGRGSTADLAYPGKDSATYKGSIALPLHLGSTLSHYNDTAGFSVDVLDWESPSQVRVRVGPGPKVATKFIFETKNEDIDSVPVEKGNYTFKEGERFCIKGTYLWSRAQCRQKIVTRVRYPDARGFNVTWKVAGQPLAGAGGTIQVRTTSGSVMPVPDGSSQTRYVKIAYQIAALADGSVLSLYNDPADRNYGGLELAATFASRVGNRTDFTNISFTGETLTWDDNYHRDLLTCLLRRSEFSKRHTRVKVVLPPDLWQPMGPKAQKQTELLLNIYGGAKSPRERSSALKLLRELTGQVRLKPIVIPSKGSSLTPPRIREHPDAKPFSAQLQPLPTKRRNRA